LPNGATASPIGQSGNQAGLVINGGTLQYTGTGNSTDRVISLGTNATLDASGTGALHLNSTEILIVGKGAHTLTLAGSSTADNTVGTSIGDTSTGATSLTKTGAGTWALSDFNIYTGVTTISGGTLAVNRLVNGGTVSGIGRSSSAAANLVIDGGT